MKHTPFYCLEDTYNWQGICISRQNMCNWSLKVNERLKPLETLLNLELKKTKLLMFDESPVEVLKVDSEELKAEYWDEARYRKKADDLEEECSKNCYMWVVLENKITQLLMLKLKMTGKNFSPGILKLLHCCHRLK